MLRTRDYALGLSIMVFLLVGIGVTLLKQGYGFGVGLPAAVFVAQPTDTSITATVSQEVAVSRAERIANLRAKIAALGTLGTEVESTQEESGATSTETTAVAVVDIAENRCASYAPFAGVWDSRGLTVSEVEGARIVFKESPLLLASGTPPLTSPPKQTLLQLAVKNLPPRTASCIASDVIGITKHGSLIRNDEMAAYQTYDAAVHIGYALDGFPIYGGSDVKTDTCGGVVVGGQYRYYLHPDRKTMISCFAGQPATL